MRASGISAFGIALAYNTTTAPSIIPNSLCARSALRYAGDARARAADETRMSAAVIRLRVIGDEAGRSVMTPPYEAHWIGHFRHPSSPAFLRSAQMPAGHPRARTVSGDRLWFAPASRSR